MKEIEPRTLFLIDGMGALLSAFMLGVLLPPFQELIGLPLQALHFLAIIPIFFAVFSLYHYFKFSPNWRPFLTSIATLNILYCILTASLLVFYQGEVHLWGYVYFILEIIVVLTLSFVELKQAKV